MSIRQLFYYILFFLTGILTSSFFVKQVLAKPAFNLPDIHLHHLGHKPKTIASDSKTHLKTATILSVKQLNSMGYQKLSSVLSGFAGFRVQAGTSNQAAKISVRGFGADAAQNILMLINNVPASNPDLESFAWGQIPLPLVRRVDLLPESEGVLYGSGAVAGIINIITQNKQVAKKALHVSAGAYGYHALDALIATPLSVPHWFTQINLYHRDANGYRAHSNGHMDHFSLQLNRQAKNWDLWLNYMYKDEDQYYPGALTAPLAFNNPQAASNDTDFSKEQHHFWQFRLTRLLSVNNRFKIDLATRFMHGRGGLSGSYYHDARTDFSIRPSIRSAFNLGEQSVIARYGFFYANDRYRTDYSNLNYHAHVHQSRWAWFDLNTMPLSIAWQWDIGFRYATARTRLDNVTFGTPLYAKDINHAFIASSTLHYKPAPAWQVYWRAANHYRFPRTDEEASTQNQLPLSTQRGVSYETGIIWKKPKKMIALRLYQLDINNEISYIPYTISANINLPPTRRLGMILDSHFALDKHWLLNVNLNVVHAYFREGPFRDKTIPMVPSKWLHIRGAYQFNQNWQVVMDDYTFDHYYADTDYQNQTQAVAGYTTVNAGLDYHPRHKLYRIHVLLTNVFNRHYFGYVNLVGNTKFYYPADGRSVIVSCVFKA